VGSGFASEKLSDGHNDRPNDGHHRRQSRGGRGGPGPRNILGGGAHMGLGTPNIFMFFIPYLAGWYTTAIGSMTCSAIPVDHQWSSCTPANIFSSLDILYSSSNSRTHPILWIYIFVEFEINIWLRNLK
jgi:hypothetical protein